MVLDKKVTNKRTIEGFENFKEFSKTTKYTYNKTIYINSSTKVIITCPVHGDFEQRPGNHLQGQGCLKCKIENTAKANTLSNEQFLKRAIDKHSDFYDYSKVKYINTETKVTIICPIHGPFEQTPHDHLSGKGCRKCGILKNPANNPFTKEKFMEKANIVHSNKYDYTYSDYVTMKSRIKIVCPIHGTFTQKAANHCFGQGCPSCANITKQKRFHEHPTILYMLFFPVLGIYKLGITMEKRGIKKRYRDETEKYIVCQQIVFSSGEEAYTLEQNLLTKYKDLLYTGPKLLKNGNTEVFTINVLSNHIL